MKFLRTFVACCLLFSCPVLAEDQPQSPPEPGPESGSLRLRLLVKQRTDQKEGHYVRLEVLSVGKDAITLVGQFGYESDKSYEDYLQEAAYFTSFPEVLPTPFSTTGDERKSPQPTATIEVVPF